MLISREAAINAVRKHSDPLFLQALDDSAAVHFNVSAVPVEQLLTIYRRRARRLARSPLPGAVAHPQFERTRPLVQAATDRLVCVLEHTGSPEVQMVSVRTDDDRHGMWLLDGETGEVLCTLVGDALPGWTEQWEG
ncbi:hypothetical protein [Kineococcus arenarius]|uniref:hypothetical protein n=1 Tax=unclassified Kineococcus TaxID=2621656 RepID=UPI003D7DFE8A